jgi:hypothetical protein
MGWTAGVRFPAGVGIISLHFHVQTECVSHPVSHPMGTRRGRGMKLTTHLQLVQKVQNAWSYTPIPQYVFMV